MKQRYQSLLSGLSLFTICLSLVLPAEGKPKVKKEDIPENRRPPMTQGRSAGSRGCNISDASRSFQLITPASDSLALLTSEQPFFGWWVSQNTPYGLIFRLYESTQTLPILLREETIQSLPPTTVAMAYQLPDKTLKNNSEYLWQVELICDPDRPSSNISLEGQFKKVSSFSPDFLQPSDTGDPNNSYLYDFYGQQIKNANLQRLDGNFWEFEQSQL